MKTEKLTLVTVCDHCGKEDIYSTPCDGPCQRDYCYECCKAELITFDHAVYIRGHGDGHYCGQCLAALDSAGDKRLRALQTIKRLQHELIGFNEDFGERKKAAELLVEQLNKEYAK